ncbi:hypothetical protein OROMI_018462 [Orobanche minor]
MDQGLIKYEDESPVDAKGMGRMILDQVYELSLLGSNLRTMVRRALPQNKLEFTVVLADASPSRGVGADSPRVDGSPGESDRKRSSRQPYSQTYKVAVNFAAKIPVHAIANALRGQDSEHFQGAVRVLDITLRQNVVQKVVSTTMIVRPGPLTDFLLMNQKVDHPDCIGWVRVIQLMLRNLRIEDVNTNLDFSLRQGRGGSSDAQEINVTVYDYFVNHHNIRLKYSGDYPCINIGKPKCPIYIPIEYARWFPCNVIPRRHTKYCQKPQENMSALQQALSSNNYAVDSLLAAASTDFTQIQGRILAVPKLGFFIFSFFIFVAFLLDRGSWVLQFSVVCQSIDLRHFTPDLTGYITEGQLYIDSQLHNWQILLLFTNSDCCFAICSVRSNSDLDFLWRLALSTEGNFLKDEYESLEGLATCNIARYKL